MNEILSLAEKGSFSQHDLYIIEDTVSELRDDIERLCLSSAVRIKWGSNRTILPAFLASIWLEKPRQYPLIVESNKELLSRAERWENYESAKIVFSDLCDQLNLSFNTSLESVVEAYKVWQLSRGNEEEKTFATVPNFISFSNAQRFLTVFASAQIRPAGTISKLAIQVPAPIIFDRTDDTITVSTKLTSSEKSEITRQVSTKLLYNVDRIIDGQSLLNICPASKDILSDIRRDLVLIQDNKYDDGTIVGIGIQFNALQWNIDSVKDQIGDSSIGELVGLFATADIFLRRFPVWCDYVGLAAPSTTTPDGLAQYRLARSLLRNATSTPHLLKDVAQDRISTVLQGISTESSSPAILDGIVRSGDNLAAVALNSVSEVVVSEAKSFGGSVKKEVYSQGSKAAIKFVAENAEEITKLSGARQWPWAKWALQLIKQVSDISSLI